jgi:alginate O-acetyltransferase complex protein AlgI
MLVASYVFYMYWEPVYIILIASSTLIDYIVAIRISESTSERNKKYLLLLSLFINLGLLAFFKYYNFFLESFVSITSFDDQSFGETWSSGFLLPVGISFYTFQTMSYSIDVYLNKIKPSKHIGKFALYVSFFPQLVAGPIERASNLVPQINAIENIQFDSTRFISGFSQAIFGFFKKIVVADLIAQYVNPIFNNPGAFSSITLLIGIYLFAFQIYCDFSGYSDIAIGIARMMGFNFLENFNLPYFSKSITEFWKRWHISLSTWLKDYLYIPLGGNRKGDILTYRNLAITMLLGGLWHGASWNFVIWGALNGGLLAVERLKKKHFPQLTLGIPILNMIITFNLVCLCWVFFRASSFEVAISYLVGLLNSNNFWGINILDSSIFFGALFNVTLLIGFEYFILRKTNWESLAMNFGYKLAPLSVFLLLIIVLFGVTSGGQFIYFQF